MAKITIEQNDLTIIVEGESELQFGQDLYTNAVVALIENADIHTWEKHIDFDALGQFTAAVLVAITGVYAAEARLPYDKVIGDVSLPQAKSVAEVLPEIIRHLQMNGHLNEVIRPDDFDTDDYDLN